MNLVDRTLSGRYEIGKRLGSGGMAEVYVAHDREKHVDLAIKVMRPKYAGNKKLLGLFRREAELLEELRHPNIIRIYDTGRDGKYFFITMDLVRGSSLKDFAERQPQRISLNLISACLKKITAALHFAHRSGFIHSDIKPSNILVSSTKDFLLADFGIARVANEYLDGGTPAYMAPEMFSRTGTDAKADIYALGITVFQLLSGGVLPFTGTTAPHSLTTLKDKIGWEHGNKVPPSLASLNPNLPKGVVVSIIRAIDMNPYRRYENALQFSKAFDAGRNSALGQTIINSGTSSGSTIPNPPRKTKTKRSLKGPYLQGLSGQWEGESISLPSATFQIGRHSENHIVLSDISVSRWHATVWRRGSKTYIRDENSKMGTFVNRRQISTATLLRNGDTVQIGSSDSFNFRV
jgi:serine/threonine protein kinase